MTAAIAESPPGRKAASAAAHDVGQRQRSASRPACACVLIHKSGESFGLERCMAAHDGRAWPVPRYQHAT
jgi:hypothetical protein